MLILGGDGFAPSHREKGAQFFHVLYFTVARLWFESIPPFYSAAQPHNY